MKIMFKCNFAATLALFGCATTLPALACDLNSPTDLTCGTSFNPANPLSPDNPANRARNPYSPYFSQPVYAYGIFGLFEKNPTIIYPAGPPRTCRQGLDCPAGVIGPLSGEGQVPQAADVAAPPYSDVSPRHHSRRSSRVPK